MERVPPHNEEAEKSVLGAIMLNKDVMYEVVEFLRGSDFYYEKHEEIYNAVQELQRRNDPVDVLTVSEELKKRGTLDMVGGRGYVASLSSDVPTTINAVAYAKIVFDKSELRKLIVAATGILEKGYQEKVDADEVLEFAEREIFDISQKKEKGNMETLSQVLLKNLAMIDERAKAGTDLTGVPSGLDDLDKKTTGFQKADMIVLAARPSMGKTAFALNVAQRAAQKKKAKILIFSLEMSKEQLGLRLLAMESKVDSQKLKIGDIDKSQWDKIYAAIDNLSTGEITIDDTPGINLTEMKNKCRRLKAERGLDMVIVDYLQLMEFEGKADSRQQEITSLSRGLKHLAREMECPVIVLSQLSRAPEQRSEHRPVLSDLRESGAIEQDADIVLFLYRDEVYFPNDTEKPGVCEVLVAKNRNGPIGTVDVLWQAQYTRFVNMQHGGY